MAKSSRSVSLDRRCHQPCRLHGNGRTHSERLGRGGPLASGGGPINHGKGSRTSRAQQANTRREERPQCPNTVLTVGTRTLCRSEACDPGLPNLLILGILCKNWGDMRNVSFPGGSKRSLGLCALLVLIAASTPLPIRAQAAQT